MKDVLWPSVVFTWDFLCHSLFVVGLGPVLKDKKLRSCLSLELLIGWSAKAACGFRTFERLCKESFGTSTGRLFTFVHHYASPEVSCRMLIKFCRACINYSKLSCFLHYPLTVLSHIFTGCSQGGKETFGTALCPFNQPSRSTMLKLKKGLLKNGHGGL